MLALNLMTGLRTALDAAGSKNKMKYVLTITAPGSTLAVSYVPLNLIKVGESCLVVDDVIMTRHAVDWLSVVSMDYYGDWSVSTLGVNPSSPLDQVTAAIQAYQTIKIPPSKV